MFRRASSVYLAVLLLAACGDPEDLGRPGSDSLTGDGDGGGDDSGADEGAQDEGTGDGDGDGDGDEGGGEDGGGSGDGDGDGEDEGAGCEEASFQLPLQTTPPSVALVLDKSGSMMAQWDHDLDAQTAKVTRWNSLYHTVETILADFSDSMRFGAALFPSKWADLDGQGYANACLMANEPEVMVAPDGADAILATIPGPDALVEGGTPARQGIENALQALQYADDDAPRAMILITDGAANCAEGEIGFDSIEVFDAALRDVVESAYLDDGVPTYVIGIDILDELGSVPIANPHDELTKVALAGGAPKQGDESFYNVTNQIELGEALSTITASIECSLTLPQEPGPEHQIVVEVNGEAYSVVEDCETQDGWVFTDPNGPMDAITLCGAACTPGEATIDLVCG
jgi:hypothetical protein